MLQGRSCQTSLACGRFIAILLGLAALRAHAIDCNRNGVDDATDIQPASFGFVPHAAPFLGTIQSLAFADVDTDGDLDAIPWITGFSVHRNDGTGGFEPTPVWSQGPLGFEISGLAILDADGDSDPDLITRLEVATHLDILRNDGGSSYVRAGTIELGEEAIDAEAGDLDGDALSDLALLTATRIITLTRDAGQSGFTARAMQDIAGSPRALTLARLDGDDHTDVAVVRYLPGAPAEILVHVGSGGALLGPGRVYASGRGSTSIAAGDLDGDGDDDLITGDVDSYFEDGKVDAAGFTVLLCAGHGALDPPRSTILGRAVAEPAASDLDGDGDVDILVNPGTFPRGDLVLNSNRGDGVLAPGPLPFPPKAIALPLRLAVPADLDGDGDVDLGCLDSRSSGVILINRPIELSTDCDLNGIPDECELRHDRRDCIDCNGNGVPDHRDLAAGSSRDANGNDVPDECEGGPAYVVGFDAPIRAAGPPGQVVSIPVTAQIHTLGLAPGEPGLQGWSIVVAAEGGSIADITTDGTAAAPAPEGLRRSGFEVSGWIGGNYCDPQAASAVVLSFLEPVTLDVTGSPHDVFRMRLEAEAPDAGARQVTVRVVPGGCGKIHRRPAGDGGGASVANTNMTRLGMTVEAEVRHHRITVFAAPGFHRGDVTDDGRLDTSDPIRLLAKLFLGGVEISCRDAADANDDGRLDVSDAIGLLSYLFLGGIPPAFPGPPGSACDIDLDGDQGCEAYLSCR